MAVEEAGERRGAGPVDPGEDGRLVVDDGAHVEAKGLYILADEDLMLLGLIPICIKTSSEVLHLVL